MSVVRREITVRCDWPTCESRTVSDGWVAPPPWATLSRNSHLCPQHREKTWHEIDIERASAEARAAGESYLEGINAE